MAPPCDTPAGPPTLTRLAALPHVATPSAPPAAPPPVPGLNTPPPPPPPAAAAEAPWLRSRTAPRGTSGAQVGASSSSNVPAPPAPAGARCGAAAVLAMTAWHDGRGHTNAAHCETFDSCGSQLPCGTPLPWPPTLVLAPPPTPPVVAVCVASLWAPTACGGLVLPARPPPLTPYPLTPCPLTPYPAALAAA